jgi:hypothetical protein
MAGDGSCSPQLIEIGGTATEGVQVLSAQLLSTFLPQKTSVINLKQNTVLIPAPYAALAYDGMVSWLCYE